MLRVNFVSMYCFPFFKTINSEFLRLMFLKVFRYEESIDLMNEIVERYCKNNKVPSALKIQQKVMLGLI